MPRKISVRGVSAPSVKVTMECRSGGCVVCALSENVGQEKGGGGAKVEGDGVDVMMAAGWGEAGDAAVYDDGGRQQVAGVWSDSGDGAGVISERVFSLPLGSDVPALNRFIHPNLTCNG
ncbi:hypothetical protein Tco_0031771 [Tanacetum coccineum]